MVLMLKLVGFDGSGLLNILKKYPKASPNLNWSFNFDMALFFILNSDKL